MWDDSFWFVSSISKVWGILLSVASAWDWKSSPVLTLKLRKLERFRLCLRNWGKELKVLVLNINFESSEFVDSSDWANSWFSELVCAWFCLWIDKKLNLYTLEALGGSSHSSLMLQSSLFRKPSEIPWILLISVTLFLGSSAIAFQDSSPSDFSIASFWTSIKLINHQASKISTSGMTSYKPSGPYKNLTVKILALIQ